MKKTKSKKMTIDDLAIIVKNGFDRVDDRFKQVDIRFEKIDRRFDAIENRFMNMLDKHTDDIRILKTRVGVR